MNEMRICKRLFLVGMALGLVLVGCGDPGGGVEKSSEAKITALTLSIGDVDYPITFETDKTAKVGLPEGTTIPDTATVQTVTLSTGASGLAQGASVTIGSNGEASITITAEDGVTKGTYTVTVIIGEKLNLNSVDLSYTEVTATEGTDTGVDPTWTGSPTPTGITYSLTASTANGPTTDGSGDTVVIDTGTGKITITDVAIAANSGTYTVTATAGDSSNYLKDSTKTAEVTVGIAKRNLGTVTLTYPRSPIKAVETFSNDTGIEPAWDVGNTGGPTPEGITYSLTASTANGPTTDGSGNTVVIDESTGKITITDQASLANSGTYTVTATAGVSSNYADTTTQAAEVTVEITDTKADLSTALFEYDEVVATPGTANTIGVTPVWGANSVPPVGVTYGISGGSGSGTTVVIDTGTGKITITDAAIADNSGTYTVTATADANSNYLDGSTQTATVTVTIGEKLDLNTVDLSYTEVTATAGTANDTGVAPAWTGSPTPTGITYSLTDYTGDPSSGADGSGDTVVIDTGTGKITITDAAIADNSGTYTVTATADANSNYLDGSTQTATVTVVIAKLNLNTVDLSYTEVTATAGTANDTGVAPAWTGSPTPTGITYSLTDYTGDPSSGADGSGDTVVIDTGTGKITITAGAEAENSGTYTVTATAGSNSNYENTTTQTAPVTVTIAKRNLNTVALSYPSATTIEGTANSAGVEPVWTKGNNNDPDPIGINYRITSTTASSDGSGSTVRIDADGKITITDQAITDNSGEYTVEATAGSTSNYADTTTQTTTVTVTVAIVGAESLSDYSLSYPIAKRSAGGSISVSPVWKKGSVDGAPVGGVSYASTPSLPTGLTLNADGTISGTMPSLDKVTAYQITATGDGTDYANTATGTFLDKFVSEETYTQDTTGTAISNLTELQAMATDMSSDPSGEYYLTTHIDLSTEASWTPIASSASPFTGTLHGNGYAIYNLTIDAGTTVYQGLFASVSGATVENLGIGVTSIKGQAGVGALAGYAETATLSNIAVAPMVADAKIEATGSVVIGGNEGAYLGGAVGYQDGGSLTGYSLVSVQAPGSYLGGFVGYSINGTVSGYATGNVLGEGTSSRAGGFVGQSTNGTVSGYATGNVSGGNNTGGLVGIYSDTTVVGYASGNVSGGTYTGGLAGFGSYSTSIGYATGDVTGTNYIGGLVGQSHASSNKGYATGVVSGSDKVGGFIGTVSGNISSRISVGYATGVVTGTTDVGGFIGNVGLDYAGTIAGYWDKTSTGQDTSAGGATAVGISKTQNIVFASANSYTDSGNSNSTIFELTDFIDIFDTTNGANKTWPKLKSDSFDFIQPTVSDLNDDGTIEVDY